MSACEDALMALQDGLRMAAGEKEFHDVAGRFAQDIGHKFFAYFSTDSKFDVLTNYPKEWQECYFENEYNKIDPVVKKAAQTKNIFSWNAPEKTGCHVKRKFFGQAADFNISRGIVIPLKGGFGRGSALTFSGHDRHALDHENTDTLEVLKAASIYFDSFYNCKMGMTGNLPLTLTTRERQCLTWISQGKLLPEIAVIMNVSLAMINAFVGSIKRKLEASTLAHAVKIGISFGEIELIRP